MSLIFILLLSVFLTSCQTLRESPKPALPVISGGPKEAILLDHKYFQISYNSVERLPNWVLYKLTAEQMANRKAKRKDRFFADPLLKAQGQSPVLPTDYEGRKYDRGHMAPAEDFAWSQEAMDATFVMSNMTPQKASLNRGPWSALEKQVRAWACGEQELRVVSGPVPAEDLPRMFSGVAVPQQFFKVIVDETPPRKVVAFVYNQNDKKVSYRERAVSLAFVEKLTGYKFFNDLKEREKLRENDSLEGWKEGDCR